MISGNRAANPAAKEATMALKVSKVDVWTTTIEDRSGGLGDKVGPLADAGANFEFVFARRTPESPGKGLAMVYPVKGGKVVKAATTAGWEKSATIAALRVEGGNKAGVGAKMLKALADGGISFRGLSAATVGRAFVCYVALDSAADAARAAALLRRVG
jgi:hypothetical protein